MSASKRPALTRCELHCSTTGATLLRSIVYRRPSLPQVRAYGAGSPGAIKSQNWVETVSFCQPCTPFQLWTQTEVQW